MFSVFLGLSLVTAPALAQLKTLKITFGDTWPASGKSKKPTKLVEQLSKIRSAEISQKYEECATKAQKAQAPSDFTPWLRIAGLRCERLAFEKSKKRYKEF